MAEQKLLFSTLWDLADTAAYRYGVYGEVLSGEKAIKTSGASTTVSENATGDAVFQGFANGDLIHHKAGPDGTLSTRIITDATNAPTSVVVNSNITLASPSFWRFQKWNNGTGAEDGWFSVRGLNRKSVSFDWDTDNAASVEVSIEGRLAGGDAAIIWQESFTAVGGGPKVYEIAETLDELRVGAKITTDGGANNVEIRFTGDRFGSF